MKKQLLLVAAVAIGLSACNEDSSPTGIGHDLLKNPENAPTLGKSNYEVVLADDAIVGGEGIVVSVDEVDMSDIDFSAVSAENPGAHVIRGPNKTEYIPTRHVTEGADKTKYHMIGIDHIAEGDDKTKYKVSLTLQHITKGDDKTKYYVVLGPHITEGDDKTKYLPKGYKHILKGDDKTKYVPDTRSTSEEPEPKPASQR